MTARDQSAKQQEAKEREREERLAAALRENLRRRKGQAREIREGEGKAAD